MKVKADIATNKLDLKISGKMSKKELEKLYTEVRFCVADLQPGFNVVADYTESQVIQLSGVSTYRKLMNYLISKGVGVVVRVVDDKSVLFQQIRNLSLRICGYRPFYTSSQEEAKKIIDELIQRKGLRFYSNHFPVAEYLENNTPCTGQILNISTSGCAIGSACLTPYLNTEITVKMAFNGPVGILDEFSIKARVVRTKENEFAAEFQDLDDSQKARLLKCLLRETEREFVNDNIIPVLGNTKN